MVVSRSSWRRSGLPRVKAGEMPDDTITSTNPLPNTGPHLVPLYPNHTTNWRIGRPSTSARPPTPSPLFRVTHIEEIAYRASCRFMRHSFSRVYPARVQEFQTSHPIMVHEHCIVNLPAISLVKSLQLKSHAKPSQPPSFSRALENTTLPVSPTATVACCRRA